MESAASTSEMGNQRGTPAEPVSSRLSPRIVSGTPKGQHERLYTENVGLVGRVLSRFPLLTPETREEAYSAGLWGLWQAAQRFDKSRGFAFSSFAGDCIKNAILKLLASRKRKKNLPLISLETPIGRNGFGDGEQELADVLEDVGAEKPGAALLDQAGFDGLLSRLPVRQQEVLRAVYQEERLLADIAEEMGVTKQRAGQIHLQALARLRKDRKRKDRSGQKGQKQSGAFISV